MINFLLFLKVAYCLVLKNAIFGDAQFPIFIVIQTSSIVPVGTNFAKVKEELKIQC